MIEQAVKKGWAIPDAVFSQLPEQMAKIAKAGKPREAVRAATILLAMNNQNAQPSVRQPAAHAHLHAHLPVPQSQTNGDATAAQPDAPRIELIERIRARIAQQFGPAEGAANGGTAAGGGAGADPIRVQARESGEGGTTPRSPAGDRRDSGRRRSRKTR